MTKQIELIFVPFPVAGHLVGTIELAKSLINRDRRIHTVTVLHTKVPYLPDTYAFAKSLAAPEPRVRLVALPDLHDPPPLELFTRALGSFILEFIKKAVPLFRDALSDIISSRFGSDSVSVAGLVLDFFCVPLIDLGKELNLASYIIFTSNAGYLSMLKYLPERHRNIPSELDLSSGDEGLPIPGFVSSVPTRVMPSGLFDRESYEAWVELGGRFPDAKGILVNSATELEPQAFDYFAHLDNYPPVYPVGPIISLKDRPSPSQDSSERERVMAWLNDQPESSVVFLCFGSFGIHIESQLNETAQALEIVGCRFLWAIRASMFDKTSPDDVLPDGFADRVAGRGMVCEWAPQVEVLGHRAIGGFVSHCGWNSILESLWFGVPIVTWPMYAEQQLNAFMMVKELGLAVELRLDYDSDRGEVVAAEEIAGAVRSLMDGGDELRKKVKETSEAVRKAVTKGGSSFVAVERFIDELIGL